MWPDIGRWNRIELKLVSFVKPHHAYEVVVGKSGPIKCRFWDALHCNAPQMRSIDPSAFESESLHSLVWMINIKVYIRSTTATL